MKIPRILAALAIALLFGMSTANAQIAGLTPCAGGTLAVTGTSANVLLSTCGPVVILYNITSQEAFYTTGATSGAAATAQTSSTAAPAANTYSVPGNTYAVVDLTGPTSYLAAITATSTTTLRIVQGYAKP
jgi:hypothetical protein